MNDRMEVGFSRLVDCRLRLYLRLAWIARSGGAGMDLIIWVYCSLFALACAWCCYALWRYIERTADDA